MIKVHHIGYLVKNIKEAILEFRRMGYLIEQDLMYDKLRNVDICLLKKDNYCIELVSPAQIGGGQGSVVDGLLKRYKNSPYHICYETDCFDADLQSFLAKGFLAVDIPMPAPALQGRKVVFLMSASIGMIELLETENF